MQLDIKQAMAHEGEEQPFSFEFSLDSSLIDDGLSKFLGASLISGNYLFANEMVYVNAEFEYGYVRPCDRCLKEVKQNIKVVIKEKFYPIGDINGDYHYSEEGLDLMPLINERILLSIPAKVLCKENCKGLCFSCGRI